jgi:glutaminyl-tRNA synthetase
MGVLHPLKVVIENYPKDKTEELVAINHPGNEAEGTRMVPFSREIYVEHADFMENPPKKFFRLGLDREVRLRFAYFLTCNEVIKDELGQVVELRCTYDPATKGGNAPDGRKVRGTIHWVSAAHAISAEVRVFEPLFLDSEGGNSDDFLENVNPLSMDKLTGCMLEPSLADASIEDPVQFERTGYFCRDKDSTASNLIFNRTVKLRDSWAKEKNKT